MFKKIILSTALFAGMQSVAYSQEEYIRALVDRVAREHPGVLAAQMELTAAEQERQGVFRQMLPEVQLSSNGAVNHRDQVLSQPLSTIAVEQKIWLGGRFGASLELARSQEELAREKLREIRMNLAIQLIDGLQAYWVAQERIAIGRTTLKRLDSFVELMDRRVNSQVSPPIDATLVRSRRVQTDMDLAQSLVSQQIALTRLRQLLGEAGDADLPGQQEWRVPRQIDLTAVLDQRGKVLQAIDGHPGVRRAALEADLAKSRSDIAFSEQFPHLYLRLEQNKYDHRSTLSALNKQNMFYVGLRFSPGAGFASQSQAGAAVSKAQAAQQQAEVMRRDVLVQVNQDYEELINAGRRKQVYGAAVQDALAVSESYERQFIAGRLNWPQTLDAVRELGQMGQALADARANELAASYRLQIRLGQYNLQSQS